MGEATLTIAHATRGHLCYALSETSPWMLQLAHCKAVIQERMTRSWLQVPTLLDSCMISCNQDLSREYSHWPAFRQTCLGPTCSPGSSLWCGQSNAVAGRPLNWDWSVSTAARLICFFVIGKVSAFAGRGIVDAVCRTSGQWANNITLNNLGGRRPAIEGLLLSCQQPDWLAGQPDCIHLAPWVTPGQSGLMIALHGGRVPRNRLEGNQTDGIGFTGVYVYPVQWAYVAGHNIT